MIPCQSPPVLAGWPAAPPAATALGLQDLVVLPIFERVSAIRAAGADQFLSCVMVSEATRSRKGGVERPADAPLVPAVLAELVSGHEESSPSTDSRGRGYHLCGCAHSGRRRSLGEQLTRHARLAPRESAREQTLRLSGLGRSLISLVV
jgi:hypothetical protein